MAADSPDRESAEHRGEPPDTATESRKSESTDQPAGSADAAPSGAAASRSASGDSAADGNAEDPTAADNNAEDSAAATPHSNAEERGATIDPSNAGELTPDQSTAEEPTADQGTATEPTADESDAEDSVDEPGNPPEAIPAHQYSPAIIATAVALPVVLVVAVLVAAVLARRAPVEREPLVLGPVPAPAADGPACAALLPALPAELGEFTKSTLVEPAPPATRAWQRAEGGDAIVLRCGLDRPLEFHRASPLQVVNGVQWFEVRDRTAEVSTWFAVDRATYVAFTVPDGSGPTPLQEVSDTITAHLPAQPIDPGPLPN